MGPPSRDAEERRGKGHGGARGKGSSGKRGKGRGSASRSESSGPAPPSSVSGDALVQATVPPRATRGPELAKGSWSSLSSLSEEELSQRMKAAEAEDVVQRADEQRLRQEITLAEEGRDRARRREIAAREAAEESRRRAARSLEHLRGELSDLMKQLQEYEHAEQEASHNEAAWQAELDTMVLSQANAMEKRDELAASISGLEDQARAKETLADKNEARARHLEEKLKKEKVKMDAVRAEAEVLRREAEEEEATKMRLQEELLRYDDGVLSLVIWRYATIFLAVAAMFALIFRMF